MSSSSYNACLNYSPHYHLVNIESRNCDWSMKSCSGRRLRRQARDLCSWSLRWDARSDCSLLMQRKLNLPQDGGVQRVAFRLHQLSSWASQAGKMQFNTQLSPTQTTESEHLLCLWTSMILFYSINLQTELRREQGAWAGLNPCAPSQRLGTPSRCTGIQPCTAMVICC